MHRSVIILLILVAALPAFAASAPVVESFSATPTVPLPGQSVVLRVEARDPDCGAPPCTTACGTGIRADVVVWTDDTGRTGAFSGASSTPTGSPFSATVTWLAPSAEGTYTVRVNLTDNGGMLCGGRQTKVASLQINVSSARPPSIASCTVAPQTLPAGASATITATASDPQNRALTYAFSADAGTIAHASPSSNSATWTAPKSGGSVALRCTAIAGGVSATLQTVAEVEIGAFASMLATHGLRPTRIAATPAGIVAVDGANGVLSLLGGWKASGLQTPVAVASSGNELFVVERNARRISVWSGSGARLRELPLDLVLPNQIAIGPNAGELAISDSGAARIFVLSSSDGRVLRTIGDGMLNVPAGLAASNGRIAVADAAASRILIFSADGTLRSTLGDSTSLVRPQGLAWDATNERFIVADSYSGELLILGEENPIRGTLAGFGTSEGKLVNPIDVALVNGTTLAVTTAGGDLPSYRLSATLRPLAPATNVIAADRANDDGGAIDLTWTASSDAARVTAYRVERGEGEVFATIATTASTTCIDTTAQTGICYRYRIVATDGISEAPSDATACATARNDLAPPPPGLLIANAESPTTATIEWEPVAAADLRAYVVELNGTIARTVTTTSIALAELTPSTAYDVTVRAIDVADNVSNAATARFTTYDDAPPPAPADLIATDAKEGGILDVRWSAPQTNVPVARYRITATPEVDGWETKSIESTSTGARLTGLVNQLAYRISVIAITPWNREGEPASAAATPTAPVRALPFVETTDDVREASGLALQFSIDAEKRELRFAYRADGTTLQVTIDGANIGAPLADTRGVWTTASLQIEKKSLKSSALHALELRSTAFPSATARLAIRNVDFVPLPPREVKLDSFNTVVDLTFASDTAVELTRDGVKVPCASTTRCRDTFLENGKQSLWLLRAISPAGWTSEAVETRGHAKFSEGPPPVTDVTIDGNEVRWTPLSSALTKNGSAVAVKSYRIYAHGALLLEVTAPRATVPLTDAIVVRSVDAEGRESQ